MILQGYFEIMTERLHSLVTFAYPFTAEFTDQFGVLFETEGQNTTPNTWSGFQYSYAPAGLLENIRSSQPGKTGANYHARVIASLNKRTEYERRAYRRESCSLQKLPTGCGLSSSGGSVHQMSPVNRSS